jgi:PPIC-type PPIASE domain
VRRWLSEPLLHFSILGIALFAASSFIERHSAPESGRIIVSQGRIANLSLSFAKVWQRPPSADELDGLIRDYVREEVLSREAVAMGLDRDDTFIRRRLQQKLEFITNDVAEQAEPSDAELQEFLDKHPDKFRSEALLSFRQVFLSRHVRGDAVHADAVKLLADLQQGGPTVATDTVGDTTMLSPEMLKARAGEVAAIFGEGFASQLTSLAIGRWQGPVASAYGEHLVLIMAREDGRLPLLTEARAQVISEWTNARRIAANRDFYEQALSRYTVTVEALPHIEGEGTPAAQSPK